MCEAIEKNEHNDRDRKSQKIYHSTKKEGPKN